MKFKVGEYVRIIRIEEKVPGAEYERYIPCIGFVGKIIARFQDADYPYELDIIEPKKGMISSRWCDEELEKVPISEVCIYGL